jgi:class 3 adenylate cyclase
VDAAAASSGETSPAPAAENGRTSSGRLNKAACMRQALAKLGYDAKPKQIQGYLWKKFGLEMDTKMISTYKGTAKKTAAQSGLMQVSAVQAAEPARAKPSTGALGIADVRAVKELADHLGADKVRALLDILYQ